MEETYFSEDGGVFVKTEKIGEIKTTKQKPKPTYSDLTGRWDRMNYISAENYEVFKSNRLHQTTQERINAFELLLKKSAYEHAGGRIIAKREILGQTQFFRSSPIIRRKPDFEKRLEDIEEIAISELNRES